MIQYLCRIAFPLTNMPILQQLISMAIYPRNVGSRYISTVMGSGVNSET
jgi:hypothetical protein